MYSAKDRKLSVVDRRAKRLLTQRFLMIEKVKDANIIGILVGTLVLGRLTEMRG